MIDQVTVQKIIDAAEITSLIQEFVSLKRKDKLFSLCPFHNEKLIVYSKSIAQLKHCKGR